MKKLKPHLDKIRDKHPDCVVIVELFINYIERKPKINAISKSHLESRLLKVLQSIAEEDNNG
jgi:hypothetical protein